MEPIAHPSPVAGDGGPRVVELAGRVRAVRRAACDFLRRYAVESVISDVGGRSRWIDRPARVAPVNCGRTTADS